MTIVPQPLFAQPLEIRLIRQGYIHDTEGRIEIRMQDHGWGSLCERNPSAQTGLVMCKFMGYVVYVPII